MHRYFFITLFPVFFLSTTCAMSDSGNDGLPVIDVIGNLGTYRQIPMSEVISEVEYIPLETGQKFLVDGYADVLITDTLILVYRNYTQYCYAFTRDGKFVSNIGRHGRGPGEWMGIRGISVDERVGRIYIEDYDKVLEYTFDGEFLREIEMPLLGKNGKDMPQSISSFGDGLFLGHISNRSGHEPHNWVIFDDKGTVIKAFDNHIQMEVDAVALPVLVSTRATMLSGDAYVKEGYNDTLYRIDIHHELSPAYRFDLGVYTFPIDKYISPDEFINSFSKSVSIAYVEDIPMSQGHIFLNVMVGNDTGISMPLLPAGPRGQAAPVYGLYDIETGETELLDHDPVTHRRGFVNDIDGGLSFWPRYYNESANELVDVWDAYEIKELLTEEYFASHPAKDPAAHARLRELLENLDEGDNPVIVIAKLKK